MAVIRPNLLPELIQTMDEFELDGFDLRNGLINEGENDINEDLAIILPAIDIVGLGSPIVLTDEIMDNYMDEIQEAISQIWVEANTIEYCELAIRALENIMVPNCEYLISQAKNLPQNLQKKIEDIAQHLNQPEDYVLHCQHINEYTHAVELSISSELSKLSIFSQDLQKKRQEEEAEKERIAQERIELYIQSIDSQSSARLQIDLFLCSVEILSRGSTPTNIPISPVMGRLRDEGIRSRDLNLLSQAALNRLVFDGASSEGLEIVDRLVAKLRDNRLAGLRI